MMKMKKLLAVLLVSAMLMTACGDEGNGGSNVTPTPTPEVTQTAEPTPTPVVEDEDKDTADETGGETEDKEVEEVKPTETPEVKPVHNHSFKVVLSTVEATCTVGGSVTFRCEHCEETQTLPTTPYKHDYHLYKEETATCTKDGTKVYKCSRCGNKKSSTYKATNHVWETVSVITPATCQAEGEDSVKCKGCGRTSTITTAKKAHTFTNYSETVAATCYSLGEETATCDVCNTATDVRDIPMLNHTFDTAFTSDDTYHWNACTAQGCTAVDGKAKHNWGTGTVTTPPTCEGTGVRTFTCSCTRTKTADEPATGHAYGAWEIDDATNHKRTCANDPAHIETEAHNFVNGSCKSCPAKAISITYNGTAENVVVKDSDYISGLKCKVGEEATIYVTSADELLTFANAVNGGKNCSGKTITLGSTVNLENKEWTPIGQTGEGHFKGVFDGGYNTVSNLKISDTSADTTNNSYSSGMFGWVESNDDYIEIKNLTVDGATVSGYHNVGVIVGYSSGAIVNNCHVKNATVKGTHFNGDLCGDKIGVLAGSFQGGSKMDSCTVKDSNLTVDGRDAGQVCGAAVQADVTNTTATNVTITVVNPLTCDHDTAGGNIFERIIGRYL